MNRSSHKRKYPQNSKSQNIVNTSTPIKKSKSTDIIAQLTPIWEICRKKKLARPLRDENINKLKYILYKNNDIINEQILKKRGSRILQTFIKYCNADDLEIFYNTIKNNLNDIVISKYGKFIIQSLLTEGYRNRIINDIDIKRVIRDRVGHFILNEIYLCNNTKSKKKKNKNDNDDNKNTLNIKETSNSYVNIKDKILRTILLPNHLIILEKSERIDVYPSNAYKGYKTISKLISKNIINTELAHDLIKLQIKKSKTKIFKKLKKVVVDLLHTDSGLYVAKKMILEYNKNIEIQDNCKNDDKLIINKDIKTILKSLKDYIIKLLEYEYGVDYIIFLMEEIKDKELVKKYIIKKLRKNKHLLLNEDTEDGNIIIQGLKKIKKIIEEDGVYNEFFNGK